MPKTYDGIRFPTLIPSCLTPVRYKTYRSAPSGNKTILLEDRFEFLQALEGSLRTRMLVRVYLHLLAADGEGYWLDLCLEDTDIVGYQQSFILSFIPYA